MKSLKSINQCKSGIQKIHDIVKSHGGNIKIESNEGEGTEFIITL